MENFEPQNHEYVTHPTYTGPNCAICGKTPEGHKPPRPKKEKEPE